MHTPPPHQRTHTQTCQYLVSKALSLHKPNRSNPYQNISGWTHSDISVVACTGMPQALVVLYHSVTYQGRTTPYNQTVSEEQHVQLRDSSWETSRRTTIPRDRIRNPSTRRSGLTIVASQTSPILGARYNTS